VNNFLQKLHLFILDTLFPIQCISCGTHGKWLCASCLEKIKLQKDQVCPICEKNITPHGYTCFGCKNKNKIDGLLVSASYRSRVISRMIHACKYRFVQDFGEILGDIMIKNILFQEIPLPDVIIPIPLHSRRLRWRGFNQSEIIAKRVAETITPGFPIPLKNDILIRERFTHPQMKIKNFEARKKNMHKVFSVNKKMLSIFKGKRIWLIDDIATTGSTIFSAAEALKKAGVKEVFGIVIARQEMQPHLPADMAKNIF